MTTTRNLLPILALVLMAGCASPVLSSRLVQVYVTGTNCTVHVHLAVDGGATVTPQIGAALGDAATSNLAHEAAAAWKVSSEIGTAGTVLNGVGQLIEAKAVKP